MPDGYMFTIACFLLRLVFKLFLRKRYGLSSPCKFFFEATEKNVCCVFICFSTGQRTVESSRDVRTRNV